MKNLLFLIIATLLVSCGGGGGGGGSTGTGGSSPDEGNDNPYVSYFDLHESTPKHDDREVHVGQTIVLEFTKVVDMNSVVVNDLDPMMDSLYLEDASGVRVELDVTQDGNFLYLRPVFDLEPRMDYRLMIESFLGSVDGDLISTYKFVDFTTSDSQGINPGTNLGVTFYYEDYDHHYDVVDNYIFGYSYESRLEEPYTNLGREQKIGKDTVQYEGSKMLKNSSCQDVLMHGFSTGLQMPLHNGSSYFLSIKACNQSGCSIWSPELGFDWMDDQAINKGITEGTGSGQNCN